ncbi:unnamed protein product [Chrysodeixis includens]|uniref:Uncharacterized protein n=1 Tax=Chrysodeixis includens TaxID=689277 RepID=A0A9N8PZ05_CHRIL|nr:unnamed protein product [Chrysodeixis includens]
MEVGRNYKLTAYLKTKDIRYQVFPLKRSLSLLYPEKFYPPAIARGWYNDDTYVVVINVGKVYHVVNLTAFDLIFGQLEVEASSVLSSRTYRWYNGETYLVIVNMRDNEHVIDLTYFENVSGEANVVLKSIQSPKNEGDSVSVASLPVAGFEGLVLKLKWNDKDNYIVIVNFRNEAYTIDLHYFENVKPKVEVVLSSIQSPKSEKDILEAGKLRILGSEALVLKVD